MRIGAHITPWKWTKSRKVQYWSAGKGTKTKKGTFLPNLCTNGFIWPQAVTSLAGIRAGNKLHPQVNPTLSKSCKDFFFTNEISVLNCNVYNWGTLLINIPCPARTSNFSKMYFSAAGSWTRDIWFFGNERKRIFGILNKYFAIVISIIWYFRH